MLYLGWLQACFHSFDSWHRDGHFMQDKIHLPLRFPCQIFHAVSGNKRTYKWTLLLNNKPWLNSCILQRKAHHSCPVLVPLSQCHPQVPARQSCSSPHVPGVPSWAEGGSGGAAASNIILQATPTDFSQIGFVFELGTQWDLKDLWLIIPGKVARTQCKRWFRGRFHWDEISHCSESLHMVAFFAPTDPLSHALTDPSDFLNKSNSETVQRYPWKLAI